MGGTAAQRLEQDRGLEAEHLMPHEAGVDEARHASPLFRRADDMTRG